MERIHVLLGFVTALAVVLGTDSSLAQSTLPTARPPVIGPVGTLPVRKAVGIVENTPKPDLVITRTALYVGNPGQSGQQTGIPIYTHSRVLISIDVTNRGDASVDLHDVFCPVKLTQKPDNVNCCVALGQTLINPGETRSGGVFFIEPNQLPPGTYPMTFTVDPDNKIAEKDETNNNANVTVTILPSNLGSGLPDLTITGVATTVSPRSTRTTR